MSRYARDPISGSILPIAGGGGSSGGHAIVNENGTEMPQRSKLQINGATVTDDAQNDTTDIDIEVESGEDISYADYQQLTPEQQANGDYFIPDYPDQPEYADNVPRAGSQAYVTSDGLNNIIGNEDISSVGTTIKGAIANLGAGIRYSTSETWTGKYWIDGRKIYQKSFGGSFPSLTADTDYIFPNSLPSGIDITTMWVDYGNSFFAIGSGTARYGTRQPGFNYKNDDHVDAWMSESGLSVNIKDVGLYAGRNFMITIKYCKTTD